MLLGARCAGRLPRRGGATASSPTAARLLLRRCGLDPATPPETALAAGLAAAEPEDASTWSARRTSSAPAPGEPRVYPTTSWRCSGGARALRPARATASRSSTPCLAAARGRRAGAAGRALRAERRALLPWISERRPVVPPVRPRRRHLRAQPTARPGSTRRRPTWRSKDALDACRRLDDADQARLNPPASTPCGPSPGGASGVWGARTLSREPAWTYVNVRRAVPVTLGRWIALNLAGLAFEPNDPLLWARINRAAQRLPRELWQAGALRGATAEDAFYVKCDADTNPDEVRGGRPRRRPRSGWRPACRTSSSSVRVVLGDGAAALGPNGGAGP